MFRRLSVKAGLWVMGTLVLALLLQLALSGPLIERELQPLRDRSVAGILELARAAFLGGQLDDENFQHRFEKYDDVVVAIYDDAGRIIARNRHESSTPQQLPAALRERIVRSAHPFEYLSEPSPGSRIAAVATVQRDGVRYFVGLFDDYTTRRLSAARVQMVTLAFLCFGLVGLVGAIWLGRAIRARLLKMQDVVRDLARGELQRQLDESDDELGALGGELNRMGDALATTIAQLRDEQSRKRRMFADLSHELRTPLTSVLGYVESLAMPEIEGDAAVRRRYLSVLTQQAMTLAKLVEELGMLSQFECEGLPLQLGYVELAALAREELAGMLPRAHEKGVQLRLRELQPHVWVEGDAARLGQVLRNLLDNALRHSPAGSHVDISVDLRDARAVLAVSDRGHGIAAEDLAHVGERFYRTDSSRTRSTGGRGLGLAIARAIAESHAGTLCVRSQRGQGTCATVELPAA